MFPTYRGTELCQATVFNKGLKSQDHDSYITGRMLGCMAVRLAVLTWIIAGGLAYLIWLMI
jgi:hypothetical protein